MEFMLKPVLPAAAMTTTHHRVSSLNLIRRFRKLSQATALMALLAMQGQQAQGLIITKSDNADALNTTGSWVGGVTPGAADIALWDSTVTAANTVALGGNLSLQGLRLINPGGAVTLSAGNTLTLGTSGIDMGAATQNLTISSGLTLGNGGQVWNVATGRTLTLNTGTFSRSGGTGLSIQGAGTVSSGMTGLANTNAILGPWASIGTGTSTRYATLSGGNIAALTGTAAAAFGWPSANNNTFNYDVAAVQGNLGVGRQGNTARYTGAAGTQNWGNNNTTNVTLNGLMNAGTGTLTFSEAGGTSQGQLVIGLNNGHELVLNAANAGIQINIPIINNGANVGSLLVMGQGANTVNITSSGGNSTFTGGTTVASGTLLLSGAGNINTTSGITVNGEGAKYLHTSSVASTRTITLTRGTVDGIGTVGTVNVADGTGILTNGNGATGTLTLSALSFLGDAVVNARIANSSAPIAVSGALSTTPASGSVVVNGSATLWANGLNNLISFGSFSGSITDFTAGSFTGLNSRQSAGSLQLNGSNIALNVIGDSPKWTGLDGSQWVVGTTGASSNWKLITATTATDYIEGDIALFDDSATGPTTLQIDTANVSPASTTFNNSSLNYSLASSGAFGIAGAGSVTKSGTGSLTITSANTYTGGTVLNAGTLNVNAAGALGTGALTLNGGTLDNTSGSPVTTTTAVAQNWAGSFSTGAGSLNFNGGNATVTPGTTATLGGGTLTVGNVLLNSGTLTVAGTGSLVTTGTAVTNIGYTSGISVLNLNGPDYTSNGEVRVGGSDVNGTAPNGSGTLNITAGNVSVTALTVARGNNNQNTLSGTVNLSGGTLTSTNDVVLGFAGNNNLGRLNVSGTGTLKVGAASEKWLVVGFYDTANGQMDVSGGSVQLLNNTSIKFSIGNTATASTNVINQTAGNVTFYSDAGTTQGGTGTLDLQQSGAATVKNTYNLDGGTLTVPRVTSTLATGTRTFNFNGGTLKAPASSATFFNLGTGTARANVRNGGAIIDTNGFDVTMAQGLVHSDVMGDNATDGGLTKNSAGALTLTGTSTYTGPTTVTAGTLALSGTGALNASSGLALSGGAKFLQGSSVASTPAIAVSNGSVDGSGSIGALTLDDLSTNSLANGNLTGSGSLTLASLTFNGDGTVNTRSSGAAAPIIITGALTTTPASGTITVNAHNVAWATGLNHLISYGSFSGSLSDFTLGSLSGSLTSRQSYGSLQLSGNNLALNIIGDSPKWTGADSNQWVVGTTGASSNWKLATAATATDYIQGDEVIFDDTATGSTTVQIDTADVSPTSTTFTNSSLSYSINSTGGFGIAAGSITKNGSGTTTLTTVNTTTGAITVNAGTLEISSAGSIITSNPILTHGSLAFNSSAAHTLSSSISGTGSISTNGSGGLTITGTKTYTGDTTIGAAGLLSLGDGTTQGAVAGNIIANGALTVNTNTAQTLANTLSGSGSITKSGTGMLTLTGTHTFTGAVTNSAGGITLGNGTVNGSIAATSLTNTAGLTFNVADSTSTSNASAISGAGAVTKSGTGTLTLSGTSTYTGATNLTAGTLVSASTGALGATSNLSLSANTTYQISTDGGEIATPINSGTNTIVHIISDRATPGAGISHPLTTPGALGVGGTTMNFTSGANVTSGTGSISFTQLGLSTGFGSVSTVLHPTTASVTVGNVYKVLNAAATTLDLSGTSTGNAVTGVISNGVATISLAKSGTSTWTLSGNNTFSGGTTLNAGQLHINSTTALGTGAFTIAGGTLDNTSGSAITLSNNNALNINADFTFGGSNDLNLGTGAVTLNANRNVTLNGTATLTIGGSISGAFSLTGTGTGRLALAGANTYTGTTTADTGTTLLISTDSALGSNSGSTTVAAGGSLHLNNVAYTVAEPVFINGTGVGGLGAMRNTGTSSFAGPITAATNATIHAGGGQITFTGGLVKDGTTLTLAGGGTIIVSGTGISGASASSDLVVDGTTLVVNAASNYNGPTTVQNSGTLVANAAVTTTQVTISANSQLSGTGSINNGTGVIVMNGALVVGDSTLGAPVASQFEISGTGITTLGAMSLLEFDLFTRGGDLTGTLSASDRLKLFGALDASTGGTLVLNANGLSSFAAGDMWTLFDLTSGGSITGTLALDYSSLGLGGGLTASLNQSTGVFSISSTVVPEPSRALLLLGAGIALLLRRRRR